MAIARHRMKCVCVEEARQCRRCRFVEIVTSRGTDDVRRGDHLTRKGYSGAPVRKATLTLHAPLPRGFTLAYAIAGGAFDDCE